jgi:hypothetical protein
VGVGTTFLTSGIPATNPFIGVEGPNSPRQVYKVASCADNTHCTLTVNYGLFGEMANVSGANYSIAPPAQTNCHSSATFCGSDPNDRNLNRTQCGGMGWLYAQTLNPTFLAWADECASATLGGPTAGPTNADNIGVATLPCSGPGCDGVVTDTGVAMNNCRTSGPPCYNFTQIGNLGKNFGEAFGAPGIDNELAWRLSAIPLSSGSVISGKGLVSGRALVH